MRRVAKAGLALLALPVLTTLIEPGPPPPPERARVARLFADPIALPPRSPGERQLGPLRFLRGWALSSDDRRFGSISAMTVAGDRVTAVSDAGSVFEFAVPGTGDERLAITPLLQGPGSAERKTDRDTEAMAIAGGEAWFTFEVRNMVWRYRRADWRALGGAAPRAMRRWPHNRGAEAMLRLPDGRFLIMSEHLQEDGTSPVLLFAGDPSLPSTPSAALFYRPPEGYRVTDAAHLPDGRVLLLNRRFNLLDGVSAKLVVTNLNAFRAGAIVQGREVATLDAPLTVDNMEALSIVRDGGRTIVWIASDDNFNPLQRTLLLQFQLD